MRGWLALTTGWQRPISAAPPPVRPAKPVRNRRIRKIPREVRAQIYALHLAIEATQAEIDGLMDAHEVSVKERQKHMKRIASEHKQ